MFSLRLPFLSLAIFSFSAFAQGTDNSTASAQRIGYTGTLSSLDGGLGGTVRVVNANTLQITSYKLKDASAPALYWWGSTTTALKSGFRISNTQVTESAQSDTLDIPLDAGKTSADFMTVGLWCERFGANFGQAVLKASDGSESTAGASETVMKSGAAGMSMRSGGLVLGAVIAAGEFVVYLV